jgi:hypothetical protein
LSRVKLGTCSCRGQLLCDSSTSLVMMWMCCHILTRQALEFTLSHKIFHSSEKKWLWNDLRLVLLILAQQLVLSRHRAVATAQLPLLLTGTFCAHTGVSPHTLSFVKQNSIMRQSRMAAFLHHQLGDPSVGHCDMPSQGRKCNRCAARGGSRLVWSGFSGQSCCSLKAVRADHLTANCFFVPCSMQETL